MVNHAVSYMDPDIRTEVESKYKGHLDPRESDYVSQTRALTDLLAAATAVEKKLQNTRSIVQSSTTSLLMSVPGYSAQMRTLTPSNASISEQTIRGNLPFKEFAREKRMCF